MGWIISDYTRCSDKELMTDYQALVKEILFRIGKTKSRKKLLNIMNENLFNITIPLLTKITELSKKKK